MEGGIAKDTELFLTKPDEWLREVMVFNGGSAVDKERVKFAIKKRFAEEAQWDIMEAFSNILDCFC